MKTSSTLSIENAKIIFRNFSGKKTEYNRAGNRNFCLLIDDGNLAEDLKKDGWNVKYLSPRDEDDDEKPYLQVAVSFENIMPNIYLVTKRNKTRLTEETIDLLDTADIVNVDLIVRPYHWEVNDKMGIKAYLKTMYVTIEEDEFADKYAFEECPEELPFD